MGHFGFSYIGFIYMVMLQVPNIIWTRHKPMGYDPSSENKILLLFERVGQVFCTAVIIMFSDTNPRLWEQWIVWFVVSVLLMALYECYWIRYFLSAQTVQDFYRPFLGIPAPGATLPVAAFFLLGIYGKLIWLIIASIILGIGHIGIHLHHKRKMDKRNAS